ncbi:MAG TPA: hypothetical protein VIO36_11025 [Anaerolineaceae bacterium]
MNQPSSAVVNHPAARPLAVRVATVLFWLAGLLWLVFAEVTLALLVRAGGVSLLEWVILGFMLANAVILALIGLGLRRQKTVYYRLAVVYLALNLVLTITDQFGTADLAYILVVLAMLIFLAFTRGFYRNKGFW